MLAAAGEKLAAANRPLLIAGGGVRYSGAQTRLAAFAARTGIPVAMTQAGKSALPDSHEQVVGSLGVTGASAANKLASSADVILSVGSRLQDFTTGSNALFLSEMISINVQTHDAIKHDALALTGDADETLAALDEAMADFTINTDYADEIRRLQNAWSEDVKAVTAAPETRRQSKNALPSDSQVIGAVNRAAPENAIVVGAAGSMPGELHKLWQSGQTDGYHMEYGFSCMGYEVAAGIGVHMACPDRPNLVFAGDGRHDGDEMVHRRHVVLLSPVHRRRRRWPTRMASTTR